MLVNSKNEKYREGRRRRDGSRLASHYALVAAAAASITWHATSGNDAALRWRPLLPYRAAPAAIIPVTHAAHDATRARRRDDVALGYAPESDHAPTATVVNDDDAELADANVAAAASPDYLR